MSTTRPHKPYRSDVTDDEWEFVAPFRSWRRCGMQREGAEASTRYQRNLLRCLAEVKASCRYSVASVASFGGLGSISGARCRLVCWHKRENRRCHMFDLFSVRHLGFSQQRARNGHLMFKRHDDRLLAKFAYSFAHYRVFD